MNNGDLDILAKSYEEVISTLKAENEKLKTDNARLENVISWLTDGDSEHMKEQYDIEILEHENEPLKDKAE